MIPWQLGPKHPKEVIGDDRKRKRPEVVEEERESIQESYCYRSTDANSALYNSMDAARINKLQADVVVRGLQELGDRYDAIDAEQLLHYDDSLVSFNRHTMTFDPTLVREVYDPFINFLNTKEYVSYKDVVRTSSWESHRATHGMSDRVANRNGRHNNHCHRPNFHFCNYNRVAREFMIANALSLMKGVPFGTSEYDFVPEQRLQIGLMTCNGFPERVRTCVSDSTGPCGVSMEPNTRPDIELLDNSTGAGKTSILLTAMCLQIADDARWKAILDGTPERLRHQLRRSNLGLVTGGAYETTETARVILCFIPELLIPQWEKTAQSVKAAFERDLGITFDIWIGTTQYVRGTSKKAGVDKTLALAHSFKKPILWILKAEPKSADKTIRSSPRLHYFARIYDELSTNTEKRSFAPESMPVRQVILQATVTRLEDSTDRAHRHPLRLALKGERYNSRNTEHCAIFKQASIPGILRELVCTGIGRTMPKGIHINRVSIKCATLSGRLTKSDLNFQTLPELLTELLQKSGCHQYHPDFKRILREIENVLAPTADNESLKDRLLRAMESTVRTIEALTPPRPAPDVNGRVHVEPDTPELSAYKALNRALIKLKDALFGRLGEEGEIPTDPITFEEIQQNDVCVLFCCTQLISKQSLELLRTGGHKCPLCRQSNPTSFSIESTLDIFSKQKSIASSSQHAIKQESDSETDVDMIDEQYDTGNIEVLSLFFSELNDSKEQFPGSFIPITRIIDAQINYKRNSRILLAYHIYTYDDSEFSSASRVSSLIQAACPRLEACSGIGKHNKKDLELFESVHGGARLLMTNISETSQTVVGLNLGKADLLIIDASHRNISGSTLEQLQGRMMRPQASSCKVGRFTTLKRSFDCLENMELESPFGDKRIVILAKEEKDKHTGSSSR